MALLEVNNIEAAYGAVQALRGVSLKVEQGQIVALLGANGAGKTCSRQTLTSRRLESALVTETPTPCKPPENA